MNATSPKERPILFSGPMVRAILDGRKSQTRRIAASAERDDFGITYRALGSDQQHEWRCPYGQPGDLLWVRETWAWYGLERDRHEVVYRADQNGELPPATHGKWRPSIHMPRWASRIALEITGVRVERLQEISEQDAQAEGIIADRGFAPFGKPDYRGAFRLLWDSINGKSPWARNDWVWAVTFKRIAP